MTRRKLLQGLGAALLSLNMLMFARPAEALANDNGVIDLQGKPLTPEMLRDAFDQIIKPYDAGKAQVWFCGQEQRLADLAAKQ